MTPENLSSRLEGELRGKAPEEQWGILVDVRSYLLGGGEEGEEDEGSMLSPEDQYRLRRCFHIFTHSSFSLSLFR